MLECPNELLTTTANAATLVNTYSVLPVQQCAMNIPQKLLNNEWISEVVPQ